METLIGLRPAASTTAGGVPGGSAAQRHSSRPQARALACAAAAAAWLRAHDQQRPLPGADAQALRAQRPLPAAGVAMGVKVAAWSRRGTEERVTTVLAEGLAAAAPVAGVAPELTCMYG